MPPNPDPANNGFPPPPSSPGGIPSAAG